jgi:hypothetical protein
MAKMYFFTEFDKLKNQIETKDKFGPYWSTLAEANQGISYVNKKYIPGAYFDLISDSKAFACQESMMVVLPYYDVSTSNYDFSKVNIVLRPIKGLEIPLQSVQYYVYRGIDASSFFTQSGTQVDIVAQSNTNSEFIDRFWKEWKTDPINKSITPKSNLFGFDRTIDFTKDIQEIFYGGITIGSNKLKPILVKEGEWIGNFSSSKKIGFEIILETDILNLNISYFEKSKYIIDVTNELLVDPQTPVSLYALKIKREQVLSYIDPAAFYSMHSKLGVYVVSYAGGVKSTEKKKRQNLFEDIIDLFYTKNFTYIDIRSEKGYSYNFYENYGGQENKLLKVKADGAADFNDAFFILEGWPIFSAPTTDFGFTKKLKIKLRIDDNVEPVVFIENSKVRGLFDKRNHFINKQDLLDEINPDWTKEILFKLDTYTKNNTTYNPTQYFKIYYFRDRKPNATNPKLIKRENYLDGVFGSISLPTIDGSTINGKNIFKHNGSTKLQYVKGSDFSYVAYPQSYQDENSIVFFSEIEFSNLSTKNVRPKELNNTNTISQSPVFPSSIAFQKTKIIETVGASEKYVLNIISYKNSKKKATNKEDAFVLGITKTQWEDLINQSGTLDSKHGKYFVFETAGTNLKDVNGISYHKFLLKIQGIDLDGNVVLVAPSTPIDIYTFKDQVFASNEFTSLSTIPEGHPDPTQIKQWDHVGVWKYREYGDKNVGIFDRESIPGVIFGNENSYKGKFDITLNANVFFPTDSDRISSISDISSVNNDYPLIVIIPGNGHNYESYDKLANYLAQNGFIVASIKCTFIEDELIIRKDKSDPSNIKDYIYFNEDKFIYDSVANTLTFWHRNGITNINPKPTITSFTPNLSTDPPYIKLNNKAVNEHGATSIGRAFILFHHLSVLKKEFKNKLQNNIGLIGHSRGGEAVLTAEKMVRQNLVPGNINISGIDNITGLFSLAPTDSYDFEMLKSQNTNPSNIPYFVLYGSLDGDVSTTSYEISESNEIIVRQTGFPLWDRAYTAFKSMAFVKGATHNGFITNNDDYGSVLGDDLADVALQQNICTGYVNAFFRKTLLGETVWEGMLKGDWIPLSITNITNTIDMQHKNSDSAMIENYNVMNDELDFSDGKVTAILKTGQNSSSTFIPDIDPHKTIKNPDFFPTRLDPFSPHASKARMIDISKSTNTSYIINLNTSISIASYQFLSFRVAILFGMEYNEISKLWSRNNTVSLPNLRVKINGISNLNPIKLELSHERLDNTALTKSAMKTIRLPLSEYSNLISINSIEIDFGLNNGRVAISDIELTN